MKRASRCPVNLHTCRRGNSSVSKTYLSNAQCEQICKGCENGLSDDKIAFYATGFDSEQMEQIRLAFEGGLKIEDIEFWGKPEFHPNQMEQLRLWVESGKNLTQVRAYADPMIEPWEIEKARLSLTT